VKRSGNLNLREPLILQGYGDTVSQFKVQGSLAVWELTRQVRLAAEVELFQHP
jgi:hypothetical protein